MVLIFLFYLLSMSFKVNILSVVPSEHNIEQNNTHMVF